MQLFKLPTNKCKEPQCVGEAVKDGFCRGHWDMLFAGMTNHQRMVEKKALREMRRERVKANVPG